MADDQFFRHLTEQLEMRGQLALATVVETKGSGPSRIGRRFLIFEDGSFSGTIGGGPFEALAVADDREEYARRERFPRDAAVFQTNRLYELPREALRPGRERYVAIVTRCWETDLAALRPWLSDTAPAAKYVGLIGSARKVRGVFAKLAEEGVPGERLRRVHAPIGVEIGAVTPEEIAVSILAEMTAVRRAGNAIPGARAARVLAGTAQPGSKSVTPCPPGSCARFHWFASPPRRPRLPSRPRHGGGYRSGAPTSGFLRLILLPPGTSFVARRGATSTARATGARPWLRCGRGPPSRATSSRRC